MAKNSNPLSKHQFKKGESGNPKGRPKKLPELTEAVTKLLADEKQGITKLDLLLNEIYRRAMKGSMDAAKIILHYAYGIPKQSVNVSGSFIMPQPPGSTLIITQQDVDECLAED